MIIENELLKSEHKLEMCLEHKNFVASFCGAATMPSLVVSTSVAYLWQL
jgi:hypothetical protein